MNEDYVKIIKESYKNENVKILTISLTKE